jgi:hypothetical protein
MASLHGFLSQLGFKMAQRPSDEEPSDALWITDQPFAPQIGQSYELAFAKPLAIEGAGENNFMARKVRIDGTHPSEWFDLEEHRMLDQACSPSAIKAYRLIVS